MRKASSFFFFVLSFILAGAFVYFSIEDFYYRGIFDYCLHVTIIDASNGDEWNRNLSDCTKLIEDLKDKEFFQLFAFDR